MAFAQIQLTEESEMVLSELRFITQKNGLNLKNKQDLINKALSMLNISFKYLDNESFEQLFDLKK
jgi:hypothetical protein